VSQPCWQRITRHGFANSLFWLLAKPLDKAVGKGTLLEKLACFARKKDQLCQQLCPMLLAKLGNNFFPFSFAVFLPLNMYSIYIYIPHIYQQYRKRYQHIYIPKLHR
jgi:hypothetical protein